MPRALFTQTGFIFNRIAFDEATPFVDMSPIEATSETGIWDTLSNEKRFQDDSVPFVV